MTDHMARLRGPEGCPWDREQTHDTLIPFLIEEAYETIDAIQGGEPAALRDELGDLVLQVVFHAQLAAERGAFTFDDVVAGCADKMERRHPHVFDPAAERLATAGDVSARWDELKRRERSAPPPSLMDRSPQSLPALAKAQDVQRRAARVGFDWSEPQGVWDKLNEELTEFREAATAGDRGRMSEELGDVLFTVVNLSRTYGLDAESSLRGSIRRFASRFAHMERAAGGALDRLTPPQLDALWRSAKADEGTAGR